MENNFLDAPPSKHFDPTMELKWIKCDHPDTPIPAVLSYHYKKVEGFHSHNFDAPVYVLCQKWKKMDGKFPLWREPDAHEVWVRIPIQE